MKPNRSQVRWIRISADILGCLNLPHHPSHNIALPVDVGIVFISKRIGKLLNLQCIRYKIPNKKAVINVKSSLLKLKATFHIVEIFWKMKFHSKQGGDKFKIKTMYKYPYLHSHCNHKIICINRWDKTVDRVANKKKNNIHFISPELFIFNWSFINFIRQNSSPSLKNLSHLFLSLLYNE